MRRVAELVGVLAMATDLGLGLPIEHTIRATLMGLEVGRRLGLSPQERSDIYYLTLLRMLGCTTDSADYAHYFGDEVAFARETQHLDYGDPAAFGAWVMESFAPGLPTAEREWRIARLFGYTPERRREALQGHCEVAQMLASRLGFGGAVIQGLALVFERWDGAGGAERRTGRATPHRGARDAAVPRVGDPSPAGREGGGGGDGAAAVRRRAGSGAGLAVLRGPRWGAGRGGPGDAVGGLAGGGADASAGGGRAHGAEDELAAGAVNAVLAAVGDRGRPVRRRWPAGLTDREVDVLRRIAVGGSTQDAAAELHLSPKTVDFHLQNIYSKAGVGTRAAATLFAIQHDLLPGRDLA